MPGHIDAQLIGQIPALLLLLAAGWLIMRGDLWARSRQVEALLLLGVAAILPWAAGLVLVLLVALLALGFARASAYKAALNKMPITWNDITITLRNPAVLFHLFGLNPSLFLWPAVALLAAAALAGLGGLVWLVVAAAGPVPALSPAGAVVAANLLLAAVLIGAHQRRLVAVVSRRLTEEAHPFGEEATNSFGWPFELWDPETVAHLARHLGPHGFLVYTRSLNARHRMPIAEADTTLPEATRAAIEDSLARHVRPRPDAPAQEPLPDIVLLQLESIFDPNRAFRLDQPVRSFLFKRRAETVLLAPLRVNIVGGGSWVSEFEALTGLDARIFGYQGYYSHTSVSPFVNGGFPAFLRRHGYRTQALYSATGAFYNTRRAYGRYGFDRFLDCRELGLDEWENGDVAFVAACLPRLDPDPARPGFTFMASNGAHSPYRIGADIAISHRFAVPAEDRYTQQLNFYLYLLRQAAKAVKALHARLEDTSARTGRPYVLAIYGDHQPHSFTATSWANRYGRFDYDSVRTEAPKSQTFVHVLSNSRRVALDLPGPLPLPLLPSLLGGFVTGPDGAAYAPFNPYLYGVMGADLFPNYAFGGLFGTEGAIAGYNPQTATADLQLRLESAQIAAQQAALAAIRASGIIRI